MKRTGKSGKGKKPLKEVQSRESPLKVGQLLAYGH